MKGQWQGRFASSVGDGTILINIDDFETIYQGVAYVHPDDLRLPRTAAFFRTPDKSPKSELHTEMLFPLDPATWAIASWEKLKKDFPDAVFSKSLDAKFSMDETGRVCHGKQILISQEIVYCRNLKSIFLPNLKQRKKNGANSRNMCRN